MPRILQIRTSDELLAEVLEFEARETAYLMATYDPCEEIEEFPSEPATWPAWTDADCWVPSDPEPFEPSEIDRAWVAPLELADDAEMDAYVAWAERLEASHAVTDSDIMASGLSVG